MIIVFCGIPGSGKTTIAKLLVEELERKGRTKIFTSDEISGSFYKKIPRILKENISHTDFLILDATFYKKEWRDLVRKLAKGQKIIIIYLEAFLDTCLKRNRGRKSNILEKAVHIMYHQMEKPKNPDIFIDTDKTKPKEAVELIINKLNL